MHKFSFLELLPSPQSNEENTQEEDNGYVVFKLKYSHESVAKQCGVRKLDRYFLKTTWKVFPPRQYFLL